MSNRPRPPSIGYQLTYHNSLCGMAVTQGLPTQVVNIGLGIKQLRVEPRNTTVPVYFESMTHKVPYNSSSVFLSSFLTAFAFIADGIRSEQYCQQS